MSAERLERLRFLSKKVSRKNYGHDPQLERDIYYAIYGENRYNPRYTFDYKEAIKCLPLGAWVSELTQVHRQSWVDGKGEWWKCVVAYNDAMSTVIGHGTDIPRAVVSAGLLARVELNALDY